MSVRGTLRLTNAFMVQAMFLRTEMKHVKNVEHFAVVFFLFMMPLLLVTPAHRRTGKFFLMVPLAFVTMLMFIPQEMLQSIGRLVDFGDEDTFNETMSLL